MRINKDAAIGTAVTAFLLASAGVTYWNNQQETAFEATVLAQGSRVGNALVSYDSVVTNKGVIPLERTFNRMLESGKTYEFTMYKMATSPFIIGYQGVAKDAEPVPDSNSGP